MTVQLWGVQKNIFCFTLGSKKFLGQKEGEENEIEGIGNYRIHEYSDKFGKKLEELVKEYDMNINSVHDKL